MTIFSVLGTRPTAIQMAPWMKLLELPRGDASTPLKSAPCMPTTTGG
ncbi:hypothetical protein G7048_09110 [Diaphorobacter sp. HDW4B]|nr:hypothetical protein [Diaphorobacter sp. HDW4B]QIL70498.1 hypothetical protein G7048_09110 [Diaphorobacter sp. HDW4B]